MNKNLLSFLALLLFLLMAVGSTEESKDPTDTKKERNCKPLESPVYHNINCIAIAINKATKKRLQLAEVEFKVTTYKYKYTDQANCKGKLEAVEFPTVFEYTNSIGHANYTHGSFKYEDKNDIVVIDVSCKGPHYFPTGTYRKSKVIKYDSDPDAVFAFGLLSNDDL